MSKNRLIPPDIESIDGKILVNNLNNLQAKSEKEMMKKLSILLIFTLLALTSCLPSKPPQNSAGTATTSSDGGTTTTEPSGTPSFASSSPIYWFNGSVIENSININQSSQNYMYLRGQAIHDFLGKDNNHSSIYCFVATFNHSVAKRHLKLRAVPLSYYQPAQGAKEYLFRIDFPDKNSALSYCGNDLPIISSTGEVGVTTNSAAYALADICPTCNTNISTANISFYELAKDNSGNNLPATTSDRVSDEELELSNIGMIVTNYSSDTGGSQSNSCTNSICKAKGFDCCLDNQCVRDGQMKTNVSTHPDYTQAVADVANNPNAFVNWPSIYYVCSSAPPKDDPIDVVDDPEGDAKKILEQYIQEYHCLEEGKKEIPNYSIGTCSDPTKPSPVTCQAAGKTWSFHCNVGKCSNPIYYTKTSCEANSGTWSTVYTNNENSNGTETAYKTVRGNVWERCGCGAFPFPADAPNDSCPNYGLDITTDVLGQITSVTCKVPTPDTDPQPIQDLNFTLSMKTAPHRFYREDNGEPVDDYETITKSAHVPEGAEFSYLDEIGKNDPINGDFNMNSIMGQFHHELSGARPAASFTVEFDQSYVIAAQNGYYTPCPTCAADSWYQSFSSRPASQNGIGLVAKGFVTNRSEYQNNTTFGNYEDTVFGRACWVPPTMLPFSHKANADVKKQRRDRLETQAAYYINGYQRDWYGFNQGALIGSFDGVSWFAIGKGRRVKATSEKLFLAINSPFPDLADNSSLIVSIVADQGIDVVPEIDFNPNLDIDDPRQNHGASCQQFHQCEVDSDCVSKLGWEYTCVDTSDFRTKWPKFDIYGNEKANTESTYSIQQILHGIQPGGNKKRCVYRGAGAPCKARYASDIDANDRKQFTCAPNFYCATQNDQAFNTELVRTPNNLAFVLYGQDADVLGRPLIYSGANKELSTAIKANIGHNADIFTISNKIFANSDFGMCRPGKNVAASTHLDQHSDNDSSNRSDYISQVGSCQSNVIGDARAQSCPAFETEIGKATAKGDYLLTDTDLTTYRNNQNMCGSESKYLRAGVEQRSTFEQIESPAIGSLNDLLAPKVAQDACFRRAGSICHTDLDCSPNRLHEAQSSFLDVGYFGDTVAEKKFWQESLVCGQAQEKPLNNDPKYLEYDLTKNRCCREVKKDITMFTKISGTLANAAYPELTDGNGGLIIDQFAHKDPIAVGRYSRYASVSSANFSSAARFPATGSEEEPQFQNPEITEAGNIISIPSHQWKTIADTGRLTCCGGGFVRKFMDGTNNWAAKNRLSINPSKFKCLNYMQDLAIEAPADQYYYNNATYFPNPSEVIPKNYEKDFSRYCLSPSLGGCSQVSFPKTDSDITQNPVIPPTHSGSNNTGVLNTSPSSTPATGVANATEPDQEGSALAPFQPIPFLNTVPVHDPNNPATACQDRAAPNNYMTAGYECASTSFYLPSYISRDNITNVEIRYFSAEGSSYRAATVAVDGTTAGDCLEIQAGNPINRPSYSIGPNGVPTIRNTYYLCGEKAVGAEYLIMHVIGDVDENTGSDADGNGNFADDVDEKGDWSYAGIVITYNARNGSTYQYSTANTTDSRIRGMIPGNDLYYTTKLGKMELLGIPQIVHEPIYCNSNKDLLVPNLYKNMTTRSDFESNTNSMIYDFAVNDARELIDIYAQNTNQLARSTAEDASVSTQRVVFSDKIEHGQIFDSHKFMCCSMLGQEVSEASRCCSGYAKNNDDGNLVCKLPQGTNLSVYFNRFVSSEGVGEDQPGGGFVDEDFVPETGEPKLTGGVFTKLEALGKAYCQNETVRRGAAFGNFHGQPNNGFYANGTQDNDTTNRRYGIVDNLEDYDADNDSGYDPYLDGFKWDHHVYCE